MAVDFTKHQDEINKSWRTVVDSTDTQNWALYGYEETTNVIKLMATGCQGLEELVKEFNCSLIQYALCRVIDQKLELNELVLINWKGNSAPSSRKDSCASHFSDLTNYFKDCTQTITIRNNDEATKEHLMQQIVKISASKMDSTGQQQSSSVEVKKEVVEEREEQAGDQDQDPGDASDDDEKDDIRVKIEPDDGDRDGDGDGDGNRDGEGAGDGDGNADGDEEDDEDDDEDDIKVTIEDFDTKTIQKQTQQVKQVAPAILESNQNIIDINELDDKPWRKPGADINDFFNYGFDESSWKLYCDKQKKMKSIVNELVDAHPHQHQHQHQHQHPESHTYRIPVVNEMNKHDSHTYQIPVLPAAVPPIVIHPTREQHSNLRDLSPMVEQQQQQHQQQQHHQQQQQQQVHGRARRERQQQISSPVHLQSSGSSRSRDHRETSSRHSRSPHTKERERKHSRSRKRSKSRERRRSRSKETKKRRSRSREREDDRRSKRHKTSRRA